MPGTRLVKCDLPRLLVFVLRRLFRRDLVVTINLDVYTQLREILHQVVSERIVVVDYEEQWTSSGRVVPKAGLRRFFAFSQYPNSLIYRD